MDRVSVRSLACGENPVMRSGCSRSPEDWRQGASGAQKRLCYNRDFNTIGAAHKRKRSTKRMRRNSYLSQIWVALLALAFAGCGSNTPSNKPKLTGLKKRVLLSNQVAGAVNLLDAQKDTFTTKNLGVTSPTKLVTAGGITAAMDSAGSAITIIDNATEAVTFAAPIG